MMIMMMMKLEKHIMMMLMMTKWNKHMMMMIMMMMTKWKNL
jgi:hypothetical protein